MTKEQLAEWTVESSGQTPADEGEEAMSEEVRTKLEDIRAVADGMTDADVVARYMEKYPNLKGCFAVNADAVLLAMDAFETAENEEDIVLMGFDAGKEQNRGIEKRNDRWSYCAKSVRHGICDSCGGGAGCA